MQARGDMVFLPRKVNPDTIQLMGRWSSEIILIYLHTTINPFCQRTVSLVVTNGDYALIPLPGTTKQ